MATFWNALGGNSYTVEASDAEASLRSKEPLVLHADEKIELAFKSALDGRDKSYLTTHRILLKDGKGIGTKRKNYKSIPYSSIQGFSVQTAGSVLDGDTELRVWSTGHESTKLQFGEKEVDLFAVQQFMNAKVLSNFRPAGSQEVVKQEMPPGTHLGAAGALSEAFHWIGENAKACSTEEVQRRFQTDYPILMPEETVELAFQCGRDFTVMTNLRFLLVDVKGIIGKKIEFVTILWPCIHSWSVSTAGGFLDVDTEMTLHTNILGRPHIKQDFRKEKTNNNLWAINTCLSNKLLGPDKEALPEVDRRQGHVDDPSKTSWWSLENNRPLDAAEMNRVFHTSPPILQGSEEVEMAFKGIRDIYLFTTKRIVKVDRRGITGKKVEYTSIPWHYIIAFGVKTAGKHLDNDSEVLLWTEMMFRPGEEPEPYMAHWELDFNKHLVDIIAVKEYLGKRILPTGGNAFHSMATPVTALHPNVSNTSREEKGFEKFLSKIGSDQRAIDPTEMNTVLHQDLPILLSDEAVVMAFKAGRDMTLFTNRRVMIVDVQGWTGKKVAYLSLPYSSIMAFKAESAGDWDRDSEIDLYTRNLWTYSKVDLDFRKGKADIIMINKFLTSILLGTEQDVADYTNNPTALIASKPQAANMKSFTSWLTSNSVEQDADAATAKLFNDPPLLLKNEKCEKVYKSGRDLYVYTNLRVLLMDVKGLSGTKVAYFSLPLKWVTGWEVETAGHLDPDAEVYLCTPVTRKRKLEQDILVKRGDVMEMHQYLTNKLMFS